MQLSRTCAVHSSAPDTCCRAIQFFLLIFSGGVERMSFGPRICQASATGISTIMASITPMSCLRVRRGPLPLRLSPGPHRGVCSRDVCDGVTASALEGFRVARELPFICAV